MASTYSDTEIRVQYEYLRTQADLWNDMLAPLAGLIIGFTKDFSIQHSAKIEYNVLKEMLEVSDANIKFVRERAWEAQMVFRAMAERLEQFVAWYEEGSQFSDQLKKTAGT